MNTTVIQDPNAPAGVPGRRAVFAFDPLLLLATLGLAACSLVVIAGGTKSDVPGQPDFYVMRQGRAAVLAQAGDGREYPVSELGPGSHFGEIGLLSEDARRTATVRCLDPVSVWSLDRAGFDHLLMGELQLADSLLASRDERRLADRARLLGERPE